MIKLDKKAIDLVNAAEEKCKPLFAEIERIEFENQLKVLNAFSENNVQAYHFAGSNGYGHNDLGRQKLCQVFASCFHTEDALVSPLVTCGTEALSKCLFGLLRPGQNMLCLSGTPYDTLHDVIWGVEGQNVGSLKDYNIDYHQVELVDNDFDLPAIAEAIKKYNPNLIYIQRSRGYALRNALTIAQIERAIKEVKKHTNATIMVDNCYGEFTETLEPTDVGADVVAGSLIKNLGAGIAPCGGYVAGKKDLLELISYQMTSPAVGFDAGGYELGYKAFFQGIFSAPHVVAQSVKLVRLASMAISNLGLTTIPTLEQPISDIVCCIKFNEPNKLINFVKAIQQGSAVDSNSVPEPCEMEGYADKIIMASGSFNQGSTIEFSCDGPIRPPYAGYLQGCINYTQGKIGLINAVQTLLQ